MLFARFLKDRRGGVAPMLALGIIPLVGAVGAAVDYSRANSVRTAMQTRSNSTALMLSKDAQTLNGDQLAAKAYGYFNALFNRPEASNVQVTQQFSSPQQGSFTLTCHGSATVNTMFWRLMGQAQVDISATGEVVWGIKKLNLALALDNTGSMASSGKMTALKTAAHNLLDHAQERRKDTGRHQGVDRSVRGRRQCRHRQCRRDLDRLDRLGRRQRHLQQVVVSLESSCNNNSGTWTPKTTASGTAASTTATRTTTCSTRATGAGSPRPSTARIRRRPARPR